MLVNLNCMHTNDDFRNKIKMDLQRWTKAVCFTQETADSGGKLTLPAQL